MAKRAFVVRRNECKSIWLSSHRSFFFYLALSLYSFVHSLSFLRPFSPLLLREHLPTDQGRARGAYFAARGEDVGPLFVIARRQGDRHTVPGGMAHRRPIGMGARLSNLFFLFFFFLEGRRVCAWA